MDFDSILEALKGGGELDTVYDDLTGLYSGMMSENEAAGAKIAELAATIEALTAEISALKSKNYDLLMATKADDSEPEPEPEPEPEGNSSENIGIDDLFTDKKEDKED